MICNRRGFTLFEVLISVVIFGIALVGILPLLATSINITSESSLKSEAQILGAEKIDELKSKTAEEIATLIGDDIVGGNTSYTNSDSVLAGGIVLNRNWLIQEGNFSGGNAPSYIMNVTVSYTLKGTTYTKTFSTVWGH